MRQFSLDRRFTLVTIPFRPFQHLLTVDDQFSCLAQVHRHLVDDGVLILDIFNPSLDFLVSPVGEECGDEPEFVTPDGRRVTCRHKTVARDRFNQVNHFELIYYVAHSDGRAERRRARVSDAVSISVRGGASVGPRWIRGHASLCGLRPECIWLEVSRRALVRGEEGTSVNRPPNERLQPSTAGAMMSRRG